MFIVCFFAISVIGWKLKTRLVFNSSR